MNLQAWLQIEVLNVRPEIEPQVSSWLHTFYRCVRINVDEHGSLDASNSETSTWCNCTCTRQHTHRKASIENIFFRKQTPSLAKSKLKCLLNTLTLQENIMRSENIVFYDQKTWPQCLAAVSNGNDYENNRTHIEIRITIEPTMKTWREYYMT